MTITLAPRWQAADTELDARLLPLLRVVAKLGSLNRAVSSLGLSYRYAWGLLGKVERALGQPLVLMQRGRGARLTPFAERLIEADDAAAALLNHELRPALDALNLGNPKGNTGTSPKPLVIHASHDLALAALREQVSNAGSVSLELHFRGSLDCLASLARRECDLAGFHVPDALAGSAAFAPYRPWLRTRGLRLVCFVHRQQGLMIARGNPKRILTLTDLATKGARFVNRQPESGTRLAFDRLLASANLRPSQIRGYEMEEFTHAAVAATIASGMADAGFGIEAAARQLDLDFVPLATERYYLGIPAAALKRSETRTFLEALQGSAFAKCLAALPGYDATGIGRMISVRDALRAA